MERQGRAYLCAGAAVAGWSTVATAFKLGLRQAEPVTLVAWSAWASTLVLLLLVAAGGRLPALRAWRMRDLPRPALLGLLNPVLYYLVLFEAYDRLPAQLAQPLNYAWPLVLVLLAALWLRRPLPRRALGAMLVSLAGVAVVATRGDLAALRFDDPLGVGLALASTLVWSIYWLLNLHQDERDPLVGMTVGFIFGSGYLALLVPLAGIGWPGWRGLAWALYIGTFEMGLTFALWLAALRLSRSAAQVGGLVFAAPFLSLLVIHHVLGEPVAPSSVLGLALIVAGIVLLRRVTRDPGEPPSRRV